MAFFKSFLNSIKKVFKNRTQKKFKKSHRKFPSRTKRKKTAVPKKSKTFKRKHKTKRIKPKKHSKLIERDFLYQSKRKELRKHKKPGSRLEKNLNNKEILIGEITHFFPRIQVGVVKILNREMKVDDKVHIKGKISDFSQKVASIQIESVDVGVAKKGQLVGFKLDSPAKAGDKVFKLK